MNLTFETPDYNTTNGSSLNTRFGYFNSTSLRIFYLVGALLCFLVSLATIIVNSLYIVCLYLNRRKEWFSHSKTILSIVVIDLTVGITSLWMTLTVSMSKVNFYTCAMSQSLCLSAQITTSFSILRLCILRIMSVRRSLPGREPSARSTIIQTFILYFMSSVLCFCPVFVWSKYKPILQRCTWSEIFEENSLTVDKFMLAVMLVPTALTTSFYIILSLYLKKRQSAIFPSRRPADNRSSVWATAIKSRTANLSEVSQVDATSEQAPRASSSYESHSKSNQIGGTVPTPANKSLGKKKDKKKDVSHISARQKRLASVVRTVGAILLCSNASVLPYVILLVLKIANWPSPVNPFFGFLTSFFLMLNSIADPLIYALTLKHLREAFKKLLSRSIPCQGR